MRLAHFLVSLNDEQVFAKKTNVSIQSLATQIHLFILAGETHFCHTEWIVVAHYIHDVDVFVYVPTVELM